MRFLSKQDLKPRAGETCLLRVDLNVEKEEVKDNFRFKAIVPTLRHLLKNNVRVVILSHRGRPEGVTSDLSLSPFAPLIAKATGVSVDFIAGYRLGAIGKALAASDARVILFENLRFFRGEDKNDPSFARALAKFGDFYVNDAFAVSHRKNTSVAALAHELPAFAGLLMESELSRLGEVLRKQRRPFVLVVGGAKIADKLGVAQRFLGKMDAILAGGGAANTFLAAAGFPMGRSLVDWNSIPLARAITQRTDVVLPIDVLVKKGQVLDIGPLTSKLFATHIKRARTIIWAGPPGYFAIKGCENGTRELWKAILANKRSVTVVGGGETTASLGLLPRTTIPSNIFVSTGGGAMLEFLTGKKLPGIEALK